MIKHLLLILFFGGLAFGSNAQAPTYAKNTGATSNSTFAFGGGGSSKRVQMLYLPSDFSPTAPTAGTISNLYFMYGSTGITVNTDYVNITINLGQTTNTTFSPATTFYTGLTTVFSKANYTIPAGTAGNWFSIPLDNPITYDNTQTLIVEIYFDSYTNTSNSTGIGTFCGTTQAGKKLYTSSLTAATGTAISSWQNMGLDLSFGNCTSPPTAGTAQSNFSTVCQGSTVQLSLLSNSIGNNQTYTWQTASTASGTYTNISSSSSTPFYSANVTNTAFYRAAVTCSGVTTYSTPVQVTVTPYLAGGTYTINSLAPASATNYQSFSTAAAALKCGIAGPLVLNVVAGSGPYNEQITFDSIANTSATNTIRINGNNNTLQYANTTSADRHLIRLNGADYLTLDNLNLSIQNLTYGWGVHLTNGANNNTISNCIIDLSAVTSTTAANSGGIIGSGSTTSNTTDGNSSYNSIINNTITGGYQGIIINGLSTAETAQKNYIAGNNIQDFYATGIELTENDSTQLINNNITRRTRAAVTTFEGINLGAGNQNVVVSGNRIHDTHTSATIQSGAAYGIYATACDAPVGAENKVINNLIYNFNSGTGTIYALYNSSSNGVFYYHNTVVLDNATSTAGLTRGVWQTGAASNIQIINNLIYITRGGSGIKHALYFATAPLTPGITSNYNNLYMAAPAGTNSIGYYPSTSYALLSDWKGANGGAYDQQSISVDPLFNTANSNYLPTNPLADTAGTPVGITTDILGMARSNVKPDIGAYEFGNNPLPVKLVDFSAYSAKKDALLTWATATETNTSRFEIERSLDGIHFTTVQAVVAKGNSGSLTNYRATDLDVWATATTVVYYRLKMVDVDGHFSYSRTMPLSNKQQADAVQVFPNPVVNELYIKISLAGATPVTINLVDMAGHSLLRTNTIAGSSIKSIPGVSLLKSGVYLLQVQAGNQRYQFSIIKQ